jgi:hypothetical protein
MEPGLFAHPPGEPVPIVDPEDLKAVWHIQEKARAHAEQTGMQAATGAHFIKASCKPGADVESVSYRAMMLLIIAKYAATEIADFSKDGKLADGVFGVAARIPMKWIGVGVDHKGFPFDMDEFKRQLQSESETNH